MDKDLKISLKAARTNSGLTQSEAAAKLGVSKETIINYEKGRTVPNVDMVNKIVELYKIPYNNIIFLP